MKKFYLLFSLIPGSLAGLEAQTPQRFSYQAVVRDAAGALLSNKTVGLEVKIRQGTTTGTVSYHETHTLSSNANGLVTAEIGSGSVQSGSLSGIDWSKGPYFLETGVDPKGGISYSIQSTVPMMSVPYALYAARSALADKAPSVQAGNGLTRNGDTLNASSGSAIWNAGQLQGKVVSTTSPVSGEVLKWDGSAWAPGKDLTATGGSSTLLPGKGLFQVKDTLFAAVSQPLWNAASLRSGLISSASPAKNDVLQWDGSVWKPAALSTGSSFTAGVGLVMNGSTLDARSSSPMWNAGSLQSFGISSATPAKSDVLQWDGSAWKPSRLTGINPPVARTGLRQSGDTLDALTGSALWNASRLQDNPVSANTPSTNDVLKWNGSAWAPGTVGGGTTISCSSSSNTSFTVRGTGTGYECTDAIWITSGKLVGIGTTSPSSSFDLSIGTGGFLVNGSTTTSNIAGRLRIGSTTSSSYELQVDGDAYVTSGIRVGTTTAPASGGIMANGIIETNQRYVMNSSTTGSGTVVIRTSSGELRPQSSTRHVKEHIRDLQLSKNALFGLRPVVYNLKPALGGQQEVGLIAEEVAEVMPNLVIYGPERQWIGETGIAATDAQGREITNPDKMVPYSVHYDRLPVYLLMVIKEQEARIMSLEARLQALEAKAGK